RSVHFVLPLDYSYLPYRYLVFHEFNDSSAGFYTCATFFNGSMTSVAKINVRFSSYGTPAERCLSCDSSSPLEIMHTGFDASREDKTKRKTCTDARFSALELMHTWFNVSHENKTAKKMCQDLDGFSCWEMKHQKLKETNDSKAYSPNCKKLKCISVNPSCELESDLPIRKNKELEIYFLEGPKGRAVNESYKN
ncbi:hypothetical protein SK128_003836, partial [Halocaridina rubra]